VFRRHERVPLVHEGPELKCGINYRLSGAEFSALLRLRLE